MEGRDLSELQRFGMDKIIALAEAKGYKVPAFEEEEDYDEAEIVGRDTVWLIRNHPDHPIV